MLMETMHKLANGDNPVPLPIAPASTLTTLTTLAKLQTQTQFSRYNYK